MLSTRFDSILAVTDNATSLELIYFEGGNIHQIKQISPALSINEYLLIYCSNSIIITVSNFRCVYY